MRPLKACSAHKLRGGEPVETCLQWEVEERREIGMEHTGGEARKIKAAITGQYCGEGSPSVTPFTLPKPPSTDFMVNPVFYGSAKGSPTPESGRHSASYLDGTRPVLLSLQSKQETSENT